MDTLLCNMTSKYATCLGQNAFENIVYKMATILGSIVAQVYLWMLLNQLAPYLCMAISSGDFGGAISSEYPDNKIHEAYMGPT